MVAIVDDDLSVQRSLRSLMLSSGFRVQAFPSGAEFLAWSKLAETSCLILDLTMPEMSGSQVISHLRAMKQLMPFVVLTAAADQGEVRQQMIENGAIACLRKPAAGPELLGAIRTALRTR
jgi:FixJ family two-component response regulator